MFKTKTEVDRHVQNCLKKINSETERNLRCFSFAKLYFAVEDYEQARRYVLSYLSVKPNSSEGHKLLGKTLEKLGKKQAALEAFRTSLQLDTKQNDLVLKVCELLATDDSSLDQSGAQYFCELAQSFDPNNPIIFNLKERILSVENDDPESISKLLLKELEIRPTDVNLRIRLLKHFLQYNMIKEAYRHVSDIEGKDLDMFRNHLNWYQIVAEILVKYQKSSLTNTTLTWEYWFLFVSVLNKLTILTLDEHNEIQKSSIDYINVVFNFDQTLLKAVENVDSCSDKQLFQEFVNHYRAQLCFHLATLVLKQEKKQPISSKDNCNSTLPLFLIAYHTHPIDLHSLWLNHISEDKRRLISQWKKEAAFRCSQAGHVLLAASKDRKSTIIEKATNYSSGMWKEQIFKKVFVTRDQQIKMNSSYFLTCNDLNSITLRLPDLNDLVKFDEESQLLYPDSLHNLIWIGLNYQNLSKFNCIVFNGLPYSIKNLRNCAAETLNILDIQSFIYCSIICAKSHLNERKQFNYNNFDVFTILPSTITQYLGTVNQGNFFKAAYKMFKNDFSYNMSELRLTLIKGIESIRCIDHHGLDVKLLVTLANIFTERSKNLTKQSEIEFNEVRAELYWKAALPLLEMLKNNQIISYAPNQLFNYKSTKELTYNEICTYIENGKLFNGIQLMKKKEYEKAVNIFELLKDPYATFYEAEIFKHMADQQINQNKELVTSEMRSQNIILLMRARDCLYLTLDRLREPTIDQKHPLNAQLSNEIEKIETLLSRIDRDSTNRNDCDGMSDDNVSSPSITGADHFIQNYSLPNYLNGRSSNNVINNHLITPNRFDRREAKPSPERLDAQLRQLQATKDVAMTHILEQNKLMLESHNTLIDELKNIRHEFHDLKDIKKSVNELKTSVDELENFKTVIDLVYEMRKEISELKKEINKNNQLSEEDIYGLANDYNTTDYSINSNLPAYNPNLYANYPGRNTAGAVPSLYGPPPALYPGMYPSVAYAYGGLGLPGAPPPTLPFEQPPTPDFRTMSAANIAGQAPPILFTGQTLSHGSNIQNNLFRDPKITTSNIPTTQPILPAVTISNSANNRNLIPPVNVVITSSEPLPTAKVTTTSQAILSVTIPPQHLKNSNNSKMAAQPHNYQIPLPTTTSMLTSTPSVLTKPAPTVSTQSLLSNIAPPQYSAVNDNKTTSKNVNLGLEIDKSLNQTFDNTSRNNSQLTISNISTTSSIDEHDPRPDFKAIIPLPDEVPINTGEENEIELFNEHAKLYRYVTINDKNEWRERGVGILKILKNPTTGKIRILMRRDQVYKICANHFLTKDMSLTPMLNNEKSYIWAAYDFADEKVVLEKLCVKFKTVDDAKKFYETFENVKKDLKDDLSIKTVTDGTKEKTDSPKTSLGGFVFKSPPIFKLAEETESVTKSTAENDKSLKIKPFAGLNFNNQTKIGGSDGRNLETTFINIKTDFKPVQKIELPKLNQDNFGKTTRVLSSDDDDGTDDFVPSTEFKPVIPLPEIVQIKTGEENSEILFENHAKLLRFSNDGIKKEWKERGVGIMKLLKDDKIVRLLMRREQVHKVCCNHQLLKNMEFKFMTNSKVLTWCAKDFSEGVIQPETFAIKFENEELAQNFHKAIINAQKLLDDNNYLIDLDKQHQHNEKHLKSDTKQPIIGFGDKFRPAKGSWECKNCCIINEGKRNYCEACETPKNDSIPAKIDDNEKSGAAFSFNAKNNQNNDKTFGDIFKPKEGSWECKSCYTRNDSDKIYCVCCENPKNDTIPKKSNEKLSTGNEMKFSFGIPTNTKPSDNSIKEKDENKFNFGFSNVSTTAQSTNTETKATFTFGQRQNPVTSTQFLFGAKTTNLPETANSGFAFKPSFNTVSSPTTTTTTTIKSTSIEKQEKLDKFVFGSPQKHDFEFTPRSPRRSSGHKDDNNTSDGSYIEEESDNIYFKPVIPLPDKIDVKTGEEEEDILYNQRAKLYRFCNGEWKERGIGNIKILKRKDNGKLRVLMRREQVLKICLNHILTKDIEYLSKDEKTWLFSAPDFSEGEINHEQFCIRFKNAEIAQEFKTAINNALDNTTITPDTTVILEKELTDEEDDLEIVYETKVTPEEEKEAIRLGLPPKFMSYRQLSDCTCEQCKKDDLYFGDLLNQVKSSDKSGNTLNKPQVTESMTLRDLLTKNTKTTTFAPITTTTSNIFSSPKLPTNDPINTFSFSNSFQPNTFGQSKPVFGGSKLATTNFFGSTPNTTTTTTTPFGSNQTTTTPFGSNQTTTTPFGSNPTTTSNLFGSTPNSTSLFGQSKTLPTTNLFGSIPATTSTTTTTNSFGSTTTSTTSAFSLMKSSSGSIFGNQLSATKNSIYDADDDTTPTVTSTVSSATVFSSPSIFGGTSTFTTLKTNSSETTSSDNKFLNSTPLTTSNSGSNVFGNDTTPTVTSTVSSATISRSIFGGTSTFTTLKTNSNDNKSLNSTPLTTSNSGSNVFGTFKSNVIVKPVTTESTSNIPKEPVLDCKDGMLSFAGLAANISNDNIPFLNKTDDNKTSLAFLRAGAPVFGSSASKTVQKKDNTSIDKSANEGNAEEEYDPYYEPIVPLPEAIVVSTGEEDETCLFNERAKLYRFDTDIKEWKERGVGQMKILFHPINNTYRFLLRREQVYKVVLNQLIIPDLDIQPMTTSDKAWMWAGFNYTDDQNALEKLAVRFKSCELAQTFYAQVQDVLNKVREIQSTKLNSSTGIEDVSSDDQQNSLQDVTGEDDEEERSIIFMKRCTLFEEINGEWHEVALGNIQVIYDSDIYADRISVIDDSGLVVSDTIIGLNTEMEHIRNNCIWRAIERSNLNFEWRTLKATFSSEAAANEFYSHYLEGIQYAQECDLIDELRDYDEEPED